MHWYSTMIVVNQSLYYIYTTYILHIYYIYTTYILHIYYIYTTYILHIYYIYTTYILHIYYIYTTYILHIYYIYTTYILHISHPVMDLVLAGSAKYCHFGQLKFIFPLCHILPEIIYQHLPILPQIATYFAGIMPVASRYRLCQLLCRQIIGSSLPCSSSVARSISSKKF